jgi:hypothetical protein
MNVWHSQKNVTVPLGYGRESKKKEVERIEVCTKASEGDLLYRTHSRRWLRELYTVPNLRADVITHHTHCGAPCLRVSQKNNIV